MPLHMPLTKLTAVLAFSALTACSGMLPETRETISPEALNAPYPSLEPLDALLANAEAGSTIVDQTTLFEARVAALKRRAAALRGRSVFDGATRLKLSQASARNISRQNP
jgi:hypothetical protein